MQKKVLVQFRLAEDDTFNSCVIYTVVLPRQRGRLNFVFPFTIDDSGGKFFGICVLMPLL